MLLSVNNICSNTATALEEVINVVVLVYAWWPLLTEAAQPTLYTEAAVGQQTHHGGNDDKA